MPAEECPEYLEPFERLCRIRVEGVEFAVPDGNTVLRVLQHLELTAGAFELVYKDFCWNADCLNCTFALEQEGGTAEALGCRHRVCDGLRIAKLPRSVLRGPAFPCAPQGPDPSAPVPER